MGRQRSQIEVVQRQIAVVDHDLEVLFAELGMHVLTLRQPVVSDGCEQPYLDLAKAKAALDDTDARILHFKQIGQNIQDASSRIGHVKDLLGEHERKLRLVYSRLGVIAWEEASSQVLSETVRRLLPSIEEQQRKANSLKKNHESASRRSRESGPWFKIPLKVKELLAEKRLNRYSRSHEEFFVESGRAIAEALCIRQLASSSAVELDGEYRTLMGEIAAWKEEMDMLHQKISTEQSRLEKEGAAGSIDRKVQDLEARRKDEAESVRIFAAVYGKAICSLSNCWKEIDVHTETLRCYDQIRRHERIRKQLEQRITELEIEREITDLVLLIEQDEERVLYLRQTIDQFNRQIDDIGRTIGRNREKIGQLKHRLSAGTEWEE